MMESENVGKEKDLSVILCTWNNSRRLGITLDAIAQCEIPDGIDWELVVVNNNCTDDTDAVVAGFKDRLPITYVHEPKQGLSNARNAGLAAAAGKWVLFTDDDVRPYSQWITAYWKAFAERGEGCFFGGPVESEFEGAPPPKEILESAPWSIRGLDWGNEAREAKKGERFLAANWAALHKAILNAGAFDPNLGLDPSKKFVQVGEENELMERLVAQGMTQWYLPDAIIRHHVPSDKCTLHHIGGRKEAYGYNEEYSKSASDIQGGMLVGKVPLRLYVKLSKLYAQYRMGAIVNGSSADSYFAYRKLKGRIRAYRDR